MLAEDSRMKALLARLMRPFTKVHPEEAATVVLMTAARSRCSPRTTCSRRSASR